MGILKRVKSRRVYNTGNGQIMFENNKSGWTRKCFARRLFLSFQWLLLTRLTWEY